MAVEARERLDDALPPFGVERRDAAAQSRNRLRQIGAFAVEPGKALADLGLLAFGEQVDRTDRFALADKAVQKYIDGKPVRKFVYVRGKLANLVV